MSITTDGGRVLVFGMDGAGWDILEPLMAAGRLPMLARLARAGARGPLASTIHPHSPTAWSSFLTGMNPGRHGIYDFLRRRPGTYDVEVVSTRTRGGRALWHILSEAGVTCGVVNVPMTYPPEKVRGYFVAGTFTRDRVGALTWPRALAEELELVLGAPYRPDAHLSDLTAAAGSTLEDVLQQFLEHLLATEDARLRAMLHLVRRDRPQCAVYVVTATDRAQHSFWNAPEALQRVYEQADRALGMLLEAMGSDTTVIVMSDHGGAPMDRVMDVAAWLGTEGYWVTQSSRLAPEALAGAAFRGAASAARTLLPRGVRAAVQARVPAARGLALRYRRPAPVDWTRTRAFSEGTFGNIVLNVRGREPQGIVEPGAEYDALRGEIRARLTALVDPATGERPVAAVHAREELYQGDRVGEAPDLVAVLARGYQMVGDVLALTHAPREAEWDGCFASAQPNRFGLTGTHGPTGILLASGPGIARHAEPIAGARIVDVAPTVLHLFGLPPAADMDGRVLAEIRG